MPEFRHFDLVLVDPPFGSAITDEIVALEQLKARKLMGTTDPGLFFDLKTLFHLLESVGSSRIEGNRTTILEAIEARLGDNRPVVEERFREIQNLEQAMDYIEATVDLGTPITATLLHELHSITVQDLTREGDPTPGAYRKSNVSISGSNHLPPTHPTVPGYMENMLVFANQNVQAKRQLMLTALTHHRFAWIHPYRNGNGRVVRLLTYAMLIQRGYRVKQGQLINPTAVFGADRDTYYAKLAAADAGTAEGLLEWSEYVLRGLREEIEKIDLLLDHNYLLPRILNPSLAQLRSRAIISEREYQCLLIAAHKQQMVSGDLKGLAANKEGRSRLIRGLRDRNLLRPIEKGKRKYRLSFTNNALMWAVFETLTQEKLVPMLE